MSDYSFILDKQKIELIERCCIVLLDTSIWVRLSNGSTVQAIELREKLLKLQAQEKIICPLTAPTIWELRKQSNPSLSRSAALMEILSQNITFRSLEQIFSYEISHFIDYMITDNFLPLTTSEKYGPLLSYIASGFNLIGKESGVTIKVNDSMFREHLLSATQNRTLSQSISMWGEQSCPRSETIRNHQEACQSRREIAGNSISKARRVETELITQNILLPQFNKQLSTRSFHDKIKIERRISELPRDKTYDGPVEHILHFMPAFSAFIEVMTISGLDVNRNDQPNDFFDRELLIYGLSYPTIFAAADRWIASLIRSCDKEKMRYPAFFKFASNLDELNQHINSLVK